MPSLPGNRVVFRDGVPVASLEKGIVVNRSNADAVTMDAAVSLLYGPIRPARTERDRQPESHQETVQQDWPLSERPELEPVARRPFQHELSFQAYPVCGEGMSEAGFGGLKDFSGLSVL